MKNIKNIQFGKLAMIAAIAFMATSCQQDEVLDQYDPKPQGEMISFHIQRGWDFDKISRSTGTQYGEHISDNNLVSEDNSESMKMGVYQQPIGSWFGEANSRGTMIQSADFSEFLAFGYKTKTENGTATTTPIFVSSYHDIENNTTNNTDDAGWEKPVGTGENANGYYWPGSDYTCSFFGISMSDGKLTDTTSGTSVYNNVTTKTNTAGQIIGFDYTVPALAVNQPDIMVAAANNIPGDGSSSVSLDFKHILTAVNVKVGVKTGETTMPNGKITSIKFKNIYGKGTYSVSDDNWSGLRDFAEGNENTTGIGMQEYSVNLGTDGYTTTNRNEEAYLTTGTATFMMIPQTLHKDAMIEIVYHYTDTNRDVIISASLNGMSWPKGVEVSYLISISPDGNLKFTNTPSILDAHYVIAPIKIAYNRPKNSSDKWRLKAEILNANNEIINIEETWGIRTQLSTLQQQGYWTYNEFDTDEDTDISRSTTGDIQLYAFIPENATYNDRKVKLSLYVGSSTTPADTKTITQLGLSSARGERIEETGYVPWGFRWDSNTKIVYTIKEGGGRKILAWIYDNILDSNNVISLKGSLLAFWDDYEATINLGNIATGSMGVESTDDGWSNTDAIYNYGGLSDVADFKATLDVWEKNGYAILEDGSWPMNPNEFAARTCVMKNKFKQEMKEGSSAGQQGEVPVAVLEDNNYVWYLPASGEYSALEDAEKETSYNLKDIYWTSTAPNGNNNQAYIYTTGKGTNAISLADRSSNYGVRAKRKQ